MDGQHDGVRRRRERLESSGAHLGGDGERKSSAVDGGLSPSIHFGARCSSTRTGKVGQTSGCR